MIFVTLLIIKITKNIKNSTFNNVLTINFAIATNITAAQNIIVNINDIFTTTSTHVPEYKKSNDILLPLFNFNLFIYFYIF